MYHDGRRKIPHRTLAQYAVRLPTRLNSLAVLEALVLRGPASPLLLYSTVLLDIIAPQWKTSSVWATDPHCTMPMLSASQGGSVARAWYPLVEGGRTSTTLYGLSHSQRSSLRNKFHLACGDQVCIASLTRWSDWTGSLRSSICDFCVLFVGARDSPPSLFTLALFRCSYSAPHRSQRSSSTP